MRGRVGHQHRAVLAGCAVFVALMKQYVLHDDLKPHMWAGVIIITLAVGRRVNSTRTRTHAHTRCSRSPVAHTRTHAHTHGTHTGAEACGGMRPSIHIAIYIVSLAVGLGRHGGQQPIGGAAACRTGRQGQQASGQAWGLSGAVAMYFGSTPEAPQRHPRGTPEALQRHSRGTPVLRSSAPKVGWLMTRLACVAQVCLVGASPMIDEKEDVEGGEGGDGGGKSRGN